MEGGEGDDPLDESFQVAIARAEATQKVQHQGSVGDRLAEVTERVRHALHLAAVLSHEEVPLREQVELSVEVERSRILVLEELVLVSKPRLTGGVRLVADDVLEFHGDGAVEPREDNNVHQALGGRWRSVMVVEDMIGEDVPPQCEKDLSSPTGVVFGRQVQHNGHEGSDVVHSGGLSMESSDVVGVEARGGKGLWVHQGVLMSDRLAAEK
jgi:hypothetical protein